MRRTLLLFIPIALAQLAVPAWMIIKHERVIGQGGVFRFRTAPVDPRDPFRGEYVELEFEAEQGDWPDPMAHVSSGLNGSTEQLAWAILGQDEDGYAVITDLLAERPADGQYVRVTYATYGNARVSRVSLPFDRFYLQEGKGPRTESLLNNWDGEWEGERSEPLPAHAVVRVLNGDAVIEDLVVGDRSIQQWMNEGE